MKSVSIVVVTFNSRSELPGLIESILPEVEKFEIELIFVDNSSSDGTKQYLKSIEHSWVRHVLLDENIGLAAANNVGLKHCSGNVTIFANPDIIFSSNCISSLAKTLDDNKIVACGPKNLFVNGVEHTSFHRNWTIWHMILWKVMPVKFSRGLYNIIRNYKSQPVSFVSGSCIAVRTEQVKAINGYDSEFFLAIEDVADLCKRLKEQYINTLVYFVSSASVIHYVSKSAALVPQVTLYNTLAGSLYYSHKHGTRLSTTVLFITILTGIKLRICLRWLRHGADRNIQLLNNVYFSLRRFYDDKIKSSIITQDYFFYTPGYFTYKRIADGSMLLYSEHRQNNERSNSDYATYYTHQPLSEKNNNLIKKILKWFFKDQRLDLIKSITKKNAKILDFGSGSGHLVKKLNEQERVAYGFEPDRNGNHMIPESLILKELDEIGEHKFDLIILNHVIEHLDDAVAEVSKLKKSLVEGGQILCITPNSEALSSKIMGKYWRGIEAPRHRVIYSNASLENALKNAGLLVGLAKTTSWMSDKIMTTSLMASLGYSSIELPNAERPRLLIILGFIFRIIEGMALRLRIAQGSEILMVGINTKDKSLK